MQNVVTFYFEIDLMNNKILPILLILPLIFFTNTFAAKLNLQKVAIPLPNRVLVGYWQTWQSSAPNPSIPSLADVSSKYNVIDVAFAEISANGSVNLNKATFLQDAYKAKAISAISELNSDGRPVLISIGGQNANFNVNNQTEEITFLNSLKSMITTYGFAGVDFDIENGLTVTAGSTTANAANNVFYLIDIIKQLKAWNPNLIISLTPQTANIAYVPAISNAWNSYLPIINTIPNDIDLVQLQEYNSGSMPALNGQNYAEGSAAFIENITPILISSWTSGTVQYQGLPASKIVVGLPATEKDAAPAGGFVPFEQVKAAMAKLRSQYPGLRGIMTWDVNYDQATGYAFANSLYACAVNNQC